MTRRGWTAIAIAIVVNLAVVSVAVSLDARETDGGGAGTASGVGDAGSSRSGAAGSASTTTSSPRPDPLALPTAPPPTPITPPTSSAGAPVITRVPTTDRVVFVTIDDGLVRDPESVETVRRMRIPVTLFLVRDFAKQGQAYFQQLVALGASVEAHSVDHTNLTRLSASGQYAEICGPLDTLEGLFGRRPVLFRPPGGAYDTTTQSIAASCGFRYVVNWTAAANDGRIDWQAGGLRAGDIVLFHFRDDLVENLELLARLCRRHGFTVARLEDYLVAS